MDNRKYCNLKPINMKRIILPMVAIAALAFTAGRYEPTTTTAEVEQLQGCSIFVDAKPVKATEYLGTVELTQKDLRKNPGSWQYQHIRDLLVKKVKAKYPDAQAIILNLHDMGVDKADALRFK